MNNYQQPSVFRHSIPSVSLESYEILQIKCADFDNAIFINNTVVQANISQKDKEIDALKVQLEEVNKKLKELIKEKGK